MATDSHQPEHSVTTYRPGPLTVGGWARSSQIAVNCELKATSGLRICPRDPHTIQRMSFNQSSI